ncbi:MAG: pitrilysin family protein [Novosphingobium sp.]|nr:pitrilysin family protein [Novosphingobium sp.]
MRRFLIPLLLLFSLPAQSALAQKPTSTSQPELADLVSAVEIPYERFELDNGLVTIVHTDRKTPIVGVTVYYRIGSKHEPRGRTGFAHLYEHLFFGGSANAPHFDKPLEAAGSTATNGSTWYDRTNYVETVPAGALELALFLESDRMGYLLPAVTQDKLDKQRSVVQNEKRQGDNQPYGLVEYAVGEGLFPVGHPYRHSTIGSMADLEAATLGDVRNWFRANYGPNNVVLVLTGDIDAQTVRPMVEKWFGAIARGPEVPGVEAGPVTLATPKLREMTDQVPVLRLTRQWSGPGLNDPDTAALSIGMHILGGLASSRLDNELVRGDELAVRVTAYAQSFEQISFLEATMDIKPGVDRQMAEARFDEAIAEYLAAGPTADELRRAVTSTLSSQIGQLELVGGFSGKGATLAEGEVYSGDPGHYRKDLARMASLSPGEVKSALQRWLGRPAFALNILPGERTESGEAMGGWGDEATRPAPPPDPRSAAADLPAAPPRIVPAVTPVAALDFPEIEKAQLTNGIPIALVRRTAIPKLVLSLSFDAGIAADASDTPGTQYMMLDMLDEGTASRNATEIAMEQERLGASIGTGASHDRSSITLSALTANLVPSLELMADILRNPSFAPAEVARVREQHLADLAQALASPRALARREFSRLVHGSHPYGQPADGLGDAISLEALGPDQLRAAHATWLRPDLARISVVGDIAMAELLPLLEKAFGNWQPPSQAKPVKRLDAPIPAASPRIVLIDRPNSPQSVIVAGRVLPLTGNAGGIEALDLANDVLGGGFLARLNANLREDKGWSYGVYSSVPKPIGPRVFTIVAPVQSDRTGDAIKAIQSEMTAFPDSAPVTAEELERVTEGNIKALPQQFETNFDVLSAIRMNERLGRTDNYYETLADTYRAIDTEEIEATARQFLSPDDLVFIVVGDRRTIAPQLDGTGLTVEVREAKEDP